jgi:hypothetical protein
MEGDAAPVFVRLAYIEKAKAVVFDFDCESQDQKRQPK